MKVVFLSFFVLIFHNFILNSIQIRSMSALYNYNCIKYMGSVCSVWLIFFVLVILKLSTGRVILTNDDSPSLPSNLNSTQNSTRKITYHIKNFTQSKQNNTQENKSNNTSFFNNQIIGKDINPKTKQISYRIKPITLTYEQYLKKYKPEKQKKLKQLQNEKQRGQYLLGRAIYQLNIQNINKFNLNPQNIYKMGLNTYTDIDPIQFKQSNGIAISKDSLILKSGPSNLPKEENSSDKKSQSPINSLPIDLKPSIRKNSKSHITIDELRKFPINTRISLYTIPDQVTIDWRNISGKIYSAGICNSNYAFSVTDSLYTTLRIRNITVQPFSTQQIISCIKEHADRSDGCNRGLIEQIFNYIRTQGVGREKDNPYSDDTRLNNNLGQCNKKLLKTPEYLKNKYYLYNYNSVELGDCHEVAKLLKNTSLSGVIKNDIALQFYTKGIFTNYETDYDLNELNYPVTIVGYNHMNRAFIIKNSWDTSWGLNGFGYVHMNTGICASVYYPILS